MMKKLIAEALKPNKLASNPHGNWILEMISNSVTLPPTSIELRAALAEGFLMKIKAKTGTSIPETMNA